MSSSNFSDSKLPKSLLIHPANFTDYIQQTLGVVNFHGDYDHTFMCINLFMTLINRINKALKKGVIGKENKMLRQKRKLCLDKTVEAKLKQVWHGYVILYQRRNDNLDIVEHDIIYNVNELGIDKEPLDDLEELIKLPALEAMNPASQVKDRREVGIKIREMVPVKYAWWGYDHIQLATMTKFTENMPDETRAIFSSVDDVMTSDILVDYVSREYFNKVIKHLLIEFEDLADDMFIEIHQIIEQEKQFGGMTESENEEAGTSSMVVG